MARVELKNIGHTYGEAGGPDAFSLEDLNMAWQDGTANALLGPSGCGKTTILNMVSGLLRPRSGQVLLDGNDVTRLGAKERRIAQVFQFPVVYDTLDVFGNLAFPLRNDKQPKSEIETRVHEIAELLGLTDVLNTRARRLSAAEKQLVSLGRGIVRKDTAAVLLDEPLTVIDPKLKWHIRRTLRQVQHELKLTMIYVTHDQQEALTFADNVTVMKDGAIVQTGTPTELYEKPADPFIGYFIGSPGMNIFEGERRDGALWLGDWPIVGADKVGTLTFGIRPEFVRVSHDSASNSRPFTIKLMEDCGVYRILSLTDDTLSLKARVPESFHAGEGDTVQVQLPEEHLVYFGASGAAA